MPFKRNCDRFNDKTLSISGINVTAITQDIIMIGIDFDNRFAANALRGLVQFGPCFGISMWATSIRHGYQRLYRNPVIANNRLAADN
jgi:hypothetical protein